MPYNSSHGVLLRKLRFNSVLLPETRLGRIRKVSMNRRRRANEYFPWNLYPVFSINMKIWVSSLFYSYSVVIAYEIFASAVRQFSTRSSTEIIHAREQLKLLFHRKVLTAPEVIVPVKKFVASGGEVRVILNSARINKSGSVEVGKDIA